jgi:hypothetical protein
MSKGKKYKVQVNNASIKNSGLPSNYKEAIAEYIWNSFDAKATNVNIRFETNSITNLGTFSIEDNGEGINHAMLNMTFRPFLDSQKRTQSYQNSSYIHGKKGKGRFSFELFAAEAEWQTVYVDGEKNSSYTITIDATQKDDFYATPPVNTSRPTGTTVTFNKVKNLTTEHFSSEDLIYFLKYEFGWFLHLNKANKYQLTINGVAIDYADIIAEQDTFKQKFTATDKKVYSFLITYIRWHDKIGEKFFFYYLNSAKFEKHKDHTSFNNGNDEFFHSVFVESSYFDEFNYSKSDSITKPLTGLTQSDAAFRDLEKYLSQMLTEKRKSFIRGNANKVIDRFNAEGVLPNFNNNEYDKARKDDLETVIKELYSVEPKIFTNLGKEQKQTFVGLLNLVLDTNERENVMTIIDGVVTLSPEERTSLANVLRKTTLSRVVRTLKLIEERYEKVELLKTLVFDLHKFTNERDHVQAVVEDNYWLFGEQYNLVSADQTFEKSLKQYFENFLNQQTPAKAKRADDTRRPDIFLCRKRTYDHAVDHNSQIEENVIVELKAPSVTIGKDQFRQIQDYMDYIIEQPQFNSTTRRWKFYLVSAKIDQTILTQQASLKDRGRAHLTHQVDNVYEIYVMSWDDVFRSFDIRHKFITEKLEFDKNAIREELELNGIELSRASSTIVTRKAVKSK